MKMTSVEDFGLRLEKTTDVAELNSLEKCNSVAVSRNIKPEDITERLKSVHSITFAKLQDDEVAWAVAVAEKLLPETHQDRLPAHLRTGKALNQLILKRWFLTRSGLEELLNTSDPNIASIFLEVHEHHTITDEEKSKLCELAGQKGIELFWHMPKFHDNRGIKRRQ
ncbi:uncharacterized protein LOC108680695 [Hyalella azteca]|uniref:Uncharacterized protein LOC108680695 n=1 Tax=Hyalella azteca TaxID=294128 RepID=A0A8B7PGE9_HYAAZ|nr:uncharacterized protein LOC108680695 [Hyalella azteca]